MKCAIMILTVPESVSRVQFEVNLFRKFKRIGHSYLLLFWVLKNSRILVLRLNTKYLPKQQNYTISSTFLNRKIPVTKINNYISILFHCFAARLANEAFLIR